MAMGAAAVAAAAAVVGVALFVVRLVEWAEQQ
jgi:hypothetical protein